MRSIRQTGCVASFIAAFFGGEVQTVQHQPLTFTRDIAPIVFTHCAGCHRPGGDAPFSLLTYGDVRKRAALVARVTQNRYMPPWKPEKGFGDFAGDRRLTDADLERLRQWIDDGLAEGDRNDLPPLPVARDGWQIGTPDLVVRLPEPYRLAPDGADVFRTFVIPIPIAAGRYVNGVEFRSETPLAVHHATIKLDRTRSSRRLDEEEPGPGYDGGGSRSAAFPDGHFLGWTPGQVSRRLPNGTAWRLEPDSDLVIELHMMPTGKPELVEPSVGLFFTDQAPSRLPFIVRLGRQSIDISAGDRQYSVSDTFVLPVDVEVSAVQPHAHYLAREVKGFARLPDGSTRWLLYIKDWDFRWQDVYQYREPLQLPKGTTLEMRYTYDNSSANPRNPNRPPRRVTFGQTTSSEMGNFWIQVVARNAPDRALLARAFEPKMLRGDIDGTEKMLEVAPGNPRLHGDLAFLYLADGRVEDATAQLKEAVRLAPGVPSQHYALGTVLLSQKKLEEATEQLNEAIQLKPDLPEAYINIGVISHAQGKLEEAVASYMKAAALSPENPQAHYNLGRARTSQGRLDDAVAEYRLALKIRPDDVDTLTSLASVLASTGHTEEAVVGYRRALGLSPDLPAALIDLAWIFATSDRPDIRRPEEAVSLAGRAADLTGRRNPTVMETLAVAYFSADRVSDAVRTAEAALDLAAKAGAEDLARMIRQRLDSFRQRVR